MSAFTIAKTINSLSVSRMSQPEARLFAGAATLVRLSQGLAIASATYWDTSSAKPVGRVTATTKDNPLRVSLRRQRGRIGRIRPDMSRGRSSCARA